MENQEQPKRRGRPPGFKLTEEQKEARRKLNAEKRAQREAEEAAAEARYEEVTGKKRPKGYKRRDPNDPWTAPQRRANKATWDAKRAEADKKKKALIAAQPNMTKQEMGIESNWRPADGSDSGYYGVALRNARVSLDLPPINIKNPDEVRQRIEQYFDFCEINNKPPNMIGLGNWLGVTTGTLAKWKNGDWSADHAVGPIIQRAMAVVEESLVSQVQDNPKAMVGGIFLLKSMFHYREQQDIVISAGDQKRELTADDIAQRYLMDDKTVETDFVESEE